VGCNITDEEGTEGTPDEQAFLSAPSSADIAENIPSSMTSVESGKSKRGSPSLSNYPIYCSVNKRSVSHHTKKRAASTINKKKRDKLSSRMMTRSSAATLSLCMD